VDGREVEVDGGGGRRRRRRRRRREEEAQQRLATVEGSRGRRSQPPKNSSITALLLPNKPSEYYRFDLRGESGTPPRPLGWGLSFSRFRTELLRQFKAQTQWEIDTGGENLRKGRRQNCSFTTGFRPSFVRRGSANTLNQNSVSDYQQD
jgi:hypothetical protein